MRQCNVFAHGLINLLCRSSERIQATADVLGHFGGTLGRFWGTFGALLGHFWGTLGRFWGTFGALLGHFGRILVGSWTGLGRVLVGIRVYGNLDPVGIVLFRDGRFGEIVFLPMSVEIGKARTGAFADVDKGEDIEDVRIARIAGSALHGHGLVHPENARIGETDRLRLFLYDDAAASMIVGMDKRIRQQLS